MKRIFVVMVCLMFLCSCGTDNGIAPTELPDADAIVDDKLEMDYRTVSAAEAREIMLSGDDFVLLDVRTDEEYREKRIDGAILIPDYEIIDRAESELPDKNAVILIYCRSGRRSANTAKVLADMGYTNIYDFGGIPDWNYETIND